MFLPFNVDVPMERIPIANWVLIALTVAASFSVGGMSPEVLLNNFILLRGEDFHFLQLLGYVLVHGRLFHLLGNMLFLFCFGNAVNAKLGHTAYLLFYFSGGLFTGVAWLLFGHSFMLVGASGAIWAVVGVFFVLHPRDDVSVFYCLGFCWGTFQVSSWVLIVIYAAFDLLGLLFSPGVGVAYICHFAGSVLGAGAAIALLRARVIESTPYEQNLLELVRGDTTA